MKKQWTKRVCTLLIALIMVFSISLQPSMAVSFIGSHIENTLKFVPYYGFGATSRLHFNNAMYTWNYWSGQNLMQMINSYSTHSSTNYPSNDGKNYIYRVNAGSAYVAETHYYLNGSVMTSADININVHHSWANSAQPGCYDVWSAFLHEAGHVAGLNHSSISSAVMYHELAKNTEKRELASDDKLGVQIIYGGPSSVSTGATSNYLPETITSSDYETVVKTGLLEHFDLNDLLRASTLIVKATLESKSDAFQIIPVFGDSPSNFTDYEFTVSSNLFGNVHEGKKLTVRMEGGTAGGTTLIVEDNPEFKEGEEVLLFLYQPNMGAGYNTLGDYYYLLGLGQGAYYADPENADHYTDRYGNELSLQELKQITGKMNPDDLDADRFYKEFVENQKGNLKRGFITEEEYQALLQEAEQYATIIS